MSVLFLGVVVALKRAVCFEFLGNAASNRQNRTKYALDVSERRRRPLL